MENESRKYNWKKIRDTFIWLTLITSIAVLLFFAVRHKANARVKTLEVNIEGAGENGHLISAILVLLKRKHLHKNKYQYLESEKTGSKAE